MKKFFMNLIDKVENDLFVLERQSEKIEDYTEEAICILHIALEELKVFLKDYEFETIEEEINFFKELKPILCSRLIFYNQVWKIESKKPPTVTREYYQSHLKKIEDFYNDNIYLYQYLRLGANYFDEMFFTRQKVILRMDREDLAFEIDTTFTTLWDHRVAQVLANTLLTSYLNKKLESLEETVSPKSNLTWHLSKRALVELIYALVANKCFGDAKIRDVVNCVEASFHVQLGDVYNTFKEIKWEKLNRAEFLDELKNALLKKMDEENSSPHRGS